MSDVIRNAPGPRRTEGLRLEWPTMALLLGCYLIWGLGTTVLAAIWLPLGMVAVVLGVVLHSSLQHEALHGHPTGITWLNELLVYPAIGLFIPYARFRDTHLAHHQDARLTDPYDDPESNYLDAGDWERLPRWQQRLRVFNNTLLGRMLIGPALGQWSFIVADGRAVWAGDAQVRKGWIWFIPALAVVLGWMIWVAQMPIWAWVICCYSGLSILKIRTFLEHQAHVRARGRTVIVEDRGILAFLFLNNSLHVVHHMHPRVPWYRLQKLYAQNKARYLSRNDAYVFRSYREIFLRYFWRTKDQVPHPLWRR